MIPLIKPAQGLWPALDLNVQGVGPDQLDESIRVTYDGTQHYRQDRLRQTFASASIAAGAVIGPTIVIPGSVPLFRVRSLSAFMIDVTGAAPKALWVWMTTPQVVGATAATPAHTLMFLDPIARALVSRAAGVYQPATDLLLPGLTTFGCTLNSILAVDVSVSLNLYYEDLSPTS